MTQQTRVVISHPVHQHAYETALAAQKAGLLQAFLTGFYRTGRGWTNERLLRHLPRSVWSKADAVLRRRWHPNLDPSNVRLLGTWRFAIARVVGRPGSGRQSEVLEWAIARFDSEAAHWLEAVATPRVVHGYEGTASRFLATGRRLGARTILDTPSTHELTSQFQLESGANPKLLRRMTEVVEAERAAADIILVPSDFVAEQLISVGVKASRIVKIPYGASLPPRRTPRPRETFTALFVGRISAAKGIRELIDAWRQLDRSPAQLIVVGAPALDVAEMVRNPPAGVIFSGHLSGLALEQAYADADAFVFPSRAEGSARVVYEAMAAGLPVVTTRQAGSVVSNGLDGIVIEAGDTERLLIALRKLFDNPGEAARMGASARQTIEERYTWPEYHRKIADLYIDVCSSADN